MRNQQQSSGRWAMGFALFASVTYATACGIDQSAAPPSFDEVRGSRAVATGQDVTFSLAVTGADGRLIRSETVTRQARALGRGEIGTLSLVANEDVADLVASMLVTTDSENRVPFDRSFTATARNGVRFTVEVGGEAGAPPSRLVMAGDKGFRIVLERKLQRRTNGWLATQLTLRSFVGTRLISTVGVNVTELGAPPEVPDGALNAEAAPADAIGLINEGCGGQEPLATGAAVTDSGSPPPFAGEEDAGCISAYLAWRAAQASLLLVHAEIAALLHIGDYAGVMLLTETVLPGAREAVECAAAVLEACRRCRPNE